MYFKTKFCRHSGIWENELLFFGEKSDKKARKPYRLRADYAVKMAIAYLIIYILLPHIHSPWLF